jgi:DNA polymerase-3 subunit alpha
MSHADFVHLRVHSAYSLSEGAVRVKDLVKMCKDARMPAVAVTDTNNLFGALEFSLAAAPEGIQPIIGCQVHVTADKLPDDTGTPVVILSQNDTGYRNLLKLLGKAYLGSEDCTDPQIDQDYLSEHSDGLLLLTGGPEGPIGRLIQGGQLNAAEEFLLQLSESFKDRIYIELMRHGMPNEKATETAFLDLAYKHDIPLVATNEVFYPTKDMFEAHDALICIAAGAYLNQTERRQLTPQHYFKSAAEMRTLFADLPEAIDNTITVAKRCAYKVECIDPILPPFDCGEGRTEEDELRDQAKAGLEGRLEAQQFTSGMSEADKETIAKPYRERLDYELNIIVEMGFPGYFLIVSDFIGWAKEQGIPVGPGRGSGAGSVAAWSLLITDLDPLRFNLLFERFLNPERVSMPDFDIDFCQDRRDEVIRYVQEKYGRDHVAQIITFGKLQARAVLRDVGRVLEVPYPVVDRISKLVPNNPASPVNLGEAIDSEPQMREMIAEDPMVSRLVSMGRRLEGLYRHASTHAAGVVIGDRPLDDLIPLYRDPRSDMPVSGFNMKFVEQAGLVKFDFLGLKTLTVLKKAIEFIRQGGSEVDLAALPLDDTKTFEMLARAETVGVFQLESAGMRDVLQKLKATSFEDIIAVVALYRPGPMENIPSYILRKHGEEEPDYMYPTLEGILKETFGIIIYQEQVMQIAQELAGYTLGGADILRRAMGKKIQVEMDAQREVFVDGANNKGVPEEKASQIFDQVNKFAGYGFNKSHAAAYALIAYQTAYLKANYPVEFLAASMALDLTNTDKLNIFRQELERMGAPLLPPDVNASAANFTVETDSDTGNLGVRYALAAVKNVGEAAMEAIVVEREKDGKYSDLPDFINRLDSKSVNKRLFENLVRAGALDQIHPNRRMMHEGAEVIVRQASIAAQERASNQIGLFGTEAAPSAQLNLREVPDWPQMERMNEEFDAIGFHLSGHPLDVYVKSLERIGAQSFAEIQESGRAGLVNMAGSVVAVSERTSAKGNRYAFLKCSDASGMYEMTCFSEVLKKSRGDMEPGNCISIRASAQFEGDTLKLLCHGVEPLDKVTARAANGLKVFLDTGQPLSELKNALGASPRGTAFIKVISTLGSDQEVEIGLGSKFSITPQILSTIRSIPGISEIQEV